MQIKLIACAGGVLLTLLTLSGCGRARVGSVRGLAQVDGAPIKTGAILFVPADGSTATTGGAIKDGRYSVQVPVGVMKVSISAPRVIGSKKVYDTPNSPEMPVTVEALPARYNEQTELQIEVQAGTNQKNFELQSD